MNGRSQIQMYQFSTPINGYMTMSARDLNGPSGSSGSFQLNFNSLSETVLYDQAGGTIREVGTISYTPSATNIQFQETQGGVSGGVTVYLAPGAGNFLSFDTGPQSLTW